MKTIPIQTGALPYQKRTRATKKARKPLVFDQEKENRRQMDEAVNRFETAHRAWRSTYKDPKRLKKGERNEPEPKLEQFIPAHLRGMAPTSQPITLAPDHPSRPVQQPSDSEVEQAQTAAVAQQLPEDEPGLPADVLDGPPTDDIGPPDFGDDDAQVPGLDATPAKKTTSRKK